MAQYNDQGNNCNDTNNGEHHRFSGTNGNSHHAHHHQQPPQCQQLPVVSIDVHKGRPIRLQVKVIVPTNDHPNYNFVGKLLGPKGNSLKWLQEQTQTKMAILGKGSMRNKEKEEDLRKLHDPRYSHLNEDLHVEITAYAPAPEAYRRISNALFEIKRFLVPDYYDEIRQQQLRELGVITTDKEESYSNLISQSEIEPVLTRTTPDLSRFIQVESTSSELEVPPLKYLPPNHFAERRFDFTKHISVSPKKPAYRYSPYGKAQSPN